MERTAADIGALAFGALLAEVAATPKPGLVDRLTNGAHRDMDFSTFLASACALRHTFDAFAAAGVAGAELSPPALFPRLREIGLAAEQAMFRATDGVNTHKGMIFSLGLLAASAGLLAARGEQLRAEAAGARAAAICAEACARASAQAAKSRPGRARRASASASPTGTPARAARRRAATAPCSPYRFPSTERSGRAAQA